MPSGSAPLVIAGALARSGELVEGWIRVDGDAIADAGTSSPPRGAHRIDGVIAPGLFDLQVNGGAGCDLVVEPESIEAVDRLQLEHGVTGYLPTLISSEPERAAHAVEVIGRRIETGQSPAAGIHLEGPFLDPEFRGVHREEWLLLPADGIPAYYGDRNVRLVTLAPELPGGLDLVEELVGRGVTVSMGHTGATAESALDAIARGAGCVTHVFNAMQGLHHRYPNVPGTALVDDRVSVCVIPDGHHVYPLVLKLVARQARGRVILVTDASTAAGAPDGDYVMAGVTIHKKNGTVADDRGTLAGSALTLDEGVRKWMAATGDSLAVAVEAASERPARLVGISAGLYEGNPADLVTMDEKGFVHAVMRRGQWVTAPA